MEGIDLRLFLNAIFKRWKILVQLLVGVLGAVLVGWLITPSRYTSTAVLMLESKRQEVSQVAKDNPSVTRSTAIGVADVLSEVEVMRSQELSYLTVENLAPEVAERLGLDPESDDVPARGAGRVRRGLSIKPVANSSIIKVSFSDRDPDLVAEIVNAFVESYMEYRSNLSLKGGGLDSLEQEQERARLSLSNAETRLREFGREFNLFAATEQKDALLNVLSGLRSDSAQKVVVLAKNKQLSSDLRKKLDQGSTEIDKLEEIRRDSTTLYLENQLVALRVELAQLLQHSTEKNIEVVRVRNSIAGIEEALTQEREAVVRSILYTQDSETEGVRSEVAAYHDLELAILEELDQIRDRELQGQNLEMELELKRDSYTQVSKRLDQVRLEAAVGGSGGIDVLVASRGYRPRGRSSPPRLTPLLLVALVAGTMLALTVVLVLDFLDHSFKTPQEVESSLGVPVLATLPKSEPESEYD